MLRQPATHSRQAEDVRLPAAGQVSDDQGAAGIATAGQQRIVVRLVPEAAHGVAVHLRALKRSQSRGIDDTIMTWRLCRLNIESLSGAG